MIFARLALATPARRITDLPPGQPARSRFHAYVSFGSRYSACFLLIVQSALATTGRNGAARKQDGVSRETGLLAQWPEKGPAELWRVPLGNGFSAVSVVGERAFTLFGSTKANSPRPSAWPTARPSGKPA